VRDLYLIANNGDDPIAMRLPTRQAMARSHRIAGILVRIVMFSLMLCAPASATDPSRSAVLAAVKVYGQINGSGLKIARCRETDSTRVDAYDRAYVSYTLSVQPLLARIYVLLKEEAKRFRVAEDQFIRQVTDANDIAKAEVDRQLSINPGAFLQQCRNIAENADNLEVVGPIRERLPDEMRLIDGWR
jgi:hypothetical protein